MTRAGGFSFVELLVALTIALVVSGSAIVLMVPSQGLAASRAETADMQQRLRVAADTLYQRLVAAGAGAYGGATAGPLSDNVAPILPYRAVGASPDPPGTFRSDTITILSVPANGAQPIGTTDCVNCRGTQSRETSVSPRMTSSTSQLTQAIVTKTA